jgi:hypothetical protein
VKPPAKAINFRGRFEYLQGLQELWPLLLGKLQEITIPTLGGFTPESFRELTAIPDCAPACDAILAWAHLFEIRDEWILDAAVQTLIKRDVQAPPRWFYVPPEMPVRVFEIFPAMWIPPFAPGGQSWPKFKRQLFQNCRRQLEEYRRSVQRMWGAKHRELKIQAEWAVLWQRGWTPGQIQIRHRKKYGKNISVALIQQRVHAFADAVGLTLREGRKGPKRRSRTAA